jgi:hypothetical protein
MKYITRLKLAAIHQLCDAEEKSTEYILKLMQSKCNVDLNCCIKYMELGTNEHTKLFSEVNDLLVLFLTTQLTKGS